MYKLQLGNQTYKYLVGGTQLAVITAAGKKHLIRLAEVEDPAIERVQDGSADGRLSPAEVAEYILAEGL